MADRIQIRGDSYTAWTRANPVLSVQEMAVVFHNDSGGDGWTASIKIGNGFSKFTELEYSVFDITVNSKRIRPTEKGFYNIEIPTKTSELDNDNLTSEGDFKKEIDRLDGRINEAGSVHDLEFRVLNGSFEYRTSITEPWINLFAFSDILDGLQLEMYIDTF